MATRVIWFSEKPDDPLKLRETLEKADTYCKKQDLPFNQLVNLALRAHLKLPKVDVVKARAELKEEREAARKERAEEKRAADKKAKEKASKGKPAKGGKKGSKKEDQA